MTEEFKPETIVTLHACNIIANYKISGNRMSVYLQDTLQLDYINKELEKYWDYVSNDGAMVKYQRVSKIEMEYYSESLQEWREYKIILSQEQRKTYEGFVQGESKQIRINGVELYLTEWFFFLDKVELNKD